MQFYIVLATALGFLRLMALTISVVSKMLDLVMPVKDGNGDSRPMLKQFLSTQQLRTSYSAPASAQLITCPTPTQESSL
jgi:hypothetical protein